MTVSIDKMSQCVFNLSFSGSINLFHCLLAVSINYSQSFVYDATFNAVHYVVSCVIPTQSITVKLFCTVK